MAIPQAIKKAGKVLGGLFLGLSGGWLLTVCVGGIITLGALTTFHLAVLLSLGGIGLCLLIVGACVLYDACVNSTISALSSVKTDDSPDDKEILLGPQNTDPTVENKTYYGSTPLHNPYATNRTTPTYSPQPPSSNNPSYNPF